MTTTLSLVLPPGRTLRLSRPRGTLLDVFHGRLWVTQSGQRRDTFLAAGDTFAVAAAGVVVIEADGTVPAWLALSHGSVSLPPPEPPGTGGWRASTNALRARLGAWRTRRALRDLDDRLMRDVGVPDDVRDAVLALQSGGRRGDRERWLVRCTW